MNDNKITSLPQDGFYGLVALKTLEMRKNLLETLPAKLLDPLESVEILDLSYNQISEVDPEAFQGISQLRILRLEDNNLEKIPESVKYLTSLVELHVQRNRIKILEDGALPLPSLSSLDLRNNEISMMETNSMAEMTNLRSLKLSANKLSSVPTTALSKLSSLEILYIGQNNFFQIQENSLKGLRNLRKLDMSGCPALVSIEDAAFSENSDLLDVSITSNKMLSLLGPATFAGNPMLERVDLSDNRLEVIPSSLLPWERLKHVQVSGNPLSCGCENYFLKDVIHQMVNSSESIRVVRCWSPLELRDADLALVHLDCAGAEASSSRMKDTAGFLTIVAVTSVLSVLALLTVLLVVARIRRSGGVCFRRSAAGQPPVKDAHILQYPEMTREPRYVSGYTLKPNIVTNPYQDHALMNGASPGYHDITLMKPGNTSPGYQDTTVLVSSTDTDSCIVYPSRHQPGANTLLYKDRTSTLAPGFAGTLIHQDITTYQDPNTTSNQSNSDSGFSDCKSQVSTWSRLQHQDSKIPTWTRDQQESLLPPWSRQQDSQYSHIYADPINTSKVTTLIRFDPKSQYEDPIAMF